MNEVDKKIKDVFEHTKSDGTKFTMSLFNGKYPASKHGQPDEVVKIRTDGTYYKLAHYEVFKMIDLMMRNDIGVINSDGVQEFEKSYDKLMKLVDKINIYREENKNVVERHKS